MDGKEFDWIDVYGEWQHWHPTGPYGSQSIQLHKNNERKTFERLDFGY